MTSINLQNQGLRRMAHLVCRLVAKFPGPELKRLKRLLAN
jgi:hypothetical protein